jgi:hypothetical protein
MECCTEIVLRQLSKSETYVVPEGGRAKLIITQKNRQWLNSLAYARNRMTMLLHNVNLEKKVHSKSVTQNTFKVKHPELRFWV